MAKRKPYAGKAMKIAPTPDEYLRFVSRVSLEMMPRRVRMGSCWLWCGAKDRKGYGVLKFRGQAVWAHRFAYAAFRRAIPDEMTIDHRCRNPTCVNPRHLRCMTHSRNSQRKHDPCDDVPF